MPVEMKTASTNASPYGSYLRFGLATVLLLILGAGGWSAWASISGAVIAPGVVAVEGKPKVIQHIDGGIVGEILVRDGDRVEAGDVLIKLDPTAIQASLAIVESKWHEALVRKSRLEAELAGAEEPLPPTELWPLLEQPSVREMIRGQRKLFDARQTSTAGQIEQLEMRVAHYREQIDNLDALHQAKKKQAGLVDLELDSLRKLHAKGHTPTTRVRALEQDSARLEGETAEHLAEIAQTKGALAEAEAQILQVQHDLQEKVATELRDVIATIRELREERVAALDKLKRIEIRSPVGGLVHGQNVHTIGGVITPTEPVMQIVPQDDRLIVEARVEPQNIDQLHVGQIAALRFPAFNQRTTPELDGHVINVSADRLEDQVSGMAYYQAIIEIPKDQLDRLNGLALLPGMPVEGFIKTGERTALSYLVKPLTDQLQHAFREE